MKLAFRINPALATHRRTVQLDASTTGFPRVNSATVEVSPWKRHPTLAAAVVLVAAIFSPLTPAVAECADACQLGETSGSASCQLWDNTNGVWIDDIDDGEGQLHNRARIYLPWLRERLMPAGGVMNAIFADANYEQAIVYGGERDPAIWTGAYLAAEALRYLTTGAPDAEAQIAETVRVLHRWWNIAGDPGYLARFVAPANAAPEVLATLPANDPEVHRNQYFEGALWHWRGNVSRDQYQGVLLGYSLAYEATPDETLRALIRADVVEFAEQLMRREKRQVALIINGQRYDITMELENVVYSSAEMLNNRPTLEIDLSTQNVQGHGVLVFWPNPSEYLRQIRLLGWLPNVYLPSQAIQLAAAFRIALQVTDGVPGYEQRREALANYYESHVRGSGSWLDIAAQWKNTNDCGDSYHGLNTAFMPLFSWARLETDSVLRQQIQKEVLNSRMWPAVATHKNVFFAFIYASQTPPGTNVGTIVSDHSKQLAGFPRAPNVAVPVDLRTAYPEDKNCPGQSAVAIDVSQRVPATFIWEKQPWDPYDDGNPSRLYGGVDYLLAYWMGRYYGFIADDAPGTCLAYQESEPWLWLPDAEATVKTSWSDVDAWNYVVAPFGFSDALVIAGPPTSNGGDPGIARIREISDLGFQLRFQEWDYRWRDFGDSYHAQEKIPFIVLQPGRRLMPDGSVWEAGHFDLGGTGAWQTTFFSQPFPTPPHLFLTIQTVNGSEAISVRAKDITVDGFEAALFEEEALMNGHASEQVGYLAVSSSSGGGFINMDGKAIPYLLQTATADQRWVPLLSHRIRLEEEKSKDSEVDHTAETLHTLALGNQILAQQVSSNGGDTTALRRLAPVGDAGLEWGLVRTIDHSWQTLPFAKSYQNPVLVAKPASSNGGDPGVIRIKDLKSNSARVSYREWNYLDGWHVGEDVFYIISEAGQHDLAGLAVEAGRLYTDKLGRSDQWEDGGFGDSFMTTPLETTPVVLTSVLTYSGADTVTTRVRNIDRMGFQVAMDEQESKSDGHASETIGWVAMQPGTGTTPEGRKVEVFTARLDHNLTRIGYGEAMNRRYPVVIGDIDSADGMDPVFLQFANPLNNQIGLKLTEERSADDETAHVSENVGIFVGD